MIALGMFAAVLVAALAGAAAAAAERSLRLWGRQARWAWGAALAASLLLPAGGALLAGASPRTARDGAPIPGIRILPAVTVRARATAAGAAVAALRRAAARAARHERALALAWGALSLAALLRLAGGARALARARRRWAPAVVDATPVLVARDAGPLVVGLRRPRVVLPAWALALEAPRRAMVLRHEVEHARARDPALLAAAAVAAALVPWNPAVWWQLRRLRLAVEMDCDARVLRAHPDVARYGLLLLDVARRVAPRGRALVAALAEPTTDIERRITTMRTPPSRHRVLLTAALALAAGAATLGAVAACRVTELTPSPRAGAPEPTVGVRTVGARRDTVSVHTLPTVEAQVAPQPAPRPRVAAPDAEGPYFEFQVERPVTRGPGSTGPVYPAELRAAQVEGEVLAQFVVDREGKVELPTFKVLRTTDPRFVDAVRASLVEARYLPAMIGGRAVKQLVQQPFAFALSR